MGLPAVMGCPWGYPAALALITLAAGAALMMIAFALLRLVG